MVWRIVALCDRGPELNLAFALHTSSGIGRHLKSLLAFIFCCALVLITGTINIFLGICVLPIACELFDVYSRPQR
jgi:hypothetical protein